MKLTRDLTGQHYGRLTALELVGVDRQTEYCTTHGARWRCRCDCGTFVIVRANNLCSGKTRSCGCLRREALKKGNHRKKGDKRVIGNRLRDGARLL